MTNHEVVVSLGTTGLQTWIKGNVIPLVLLGIAVIMLAGAGKGDLHKLFKIGAGVLVSLAVLGVAVGGTGVDIGTQLSKLFN
jgi:peptidoglycan/LPS O-acetylase OafA/YrhL